MATRAPKAASAAANVSATQPAAAAAPTRQPAPVAKKPAPKPAAKKPAAPATAAPEKKREKLVRDSFTIPKGEYAAIGTLKKRAEALARPAKKSELLRAGIALLAALDDAALLKALAAVPAIKTGRPAKA